MLNHNRAGLWAGALCVLTLAGGCTSTEDAGPPPEPLRFAVICAPEISGSFDLESPTPDELLLEAVTILSVEPDLAFCLVPGPVLGQVDGSPDAEEEQEIARELLIGGLGSLACPVYVALSSDDPTLLEQLTEGVPGNPGELAFWADPLQGVQVVVLDPATGNLPEPAHADGPSDDESTPSAPTIGVLASGRVLRPPHDVTLLVKSGGEFMLHDARGAELRVPSLLTPPHLIAIVTVDPGGKVSVHAVSVWPDQEAPTDPDPLVVPGLAAPAD
ncbi:hypothetical protein OAX78_02580 [Planctomycetota bacterium]|nr:hypothetical protein [Planctomycetota bacterium]